MRRRRKEYGRWRAREEDDLQKDRAMRYTFDMLCMKYGHAARGGRTAFDVFAHQSLSEPRIRCCSGQASTYMLPGSNAELPTKKLPTAK